MENRGHGRTVFSPRIDVAVVRYRSSRVIQLVSIVDVETSRQTPRPPPSPPRYPHGMYCHEYPPLPYTEPLSVGNDAVNTLLAAYARQPGDFSRPCGGFLRLP